MTKAANNTNKIFDMLNIFLPGFLAPQRLHLLASVLTGLPQSLHFTSATIK